MPVTFRYATIDEYPQVSRFVDEQWAKDHIYVRSKPLFDWTFRGHNQWDEAGYSVAVAEDNGEWVGILGGIPFTMNRFGKSCRAAWIVNYVIRPDHRRGATALQMLSMFRRPPFEAVIAFGINPATSVIYRVLRGQVLPEIPRHLVVLPGAADRAAALFRKANPEWSAELAESLAAQFRLDRIPDAPVESAPCLPPDWDERHWPRFAESTVGAARNSAYLNWRYTRHPAFEYRYIAVRDGSHYGLAVWRLETIHIQTEEGRQPFDRIGRLVEFLPVSPDNARQLVTAFMQQLRAEDAIGADYYCYHGESRRWLEEAGVRGVPGEGDHRAIPSRFQPLDNKGGGILSAVFVPPDVPQFAQDDCPWYWTKSDSDQDRPN